MKSLEFLDMTKKPIKCESPLGIYVFLAFAEISLGQDAFLATYKADTGIDLLSLAHEPLGAAIDQATNHAAIRQAFSKYLDWLVVNHWGEDKSESQQGGAA